MKSLNISAQAGNKIFTGLLLFVISVLFLTITVSFIRAQFDLGGQSLEISPPTQEMSADPGQTITLKAKIRNRTTATVPIKVRLEDFIAQGEEGSVALSSNSQWPITSWAILSPTEFSLKPGESNEVQAVIKIPSSGVAGGRYGSFVFRVVGSGEKGAASLSQEIGSLFLIRINGPVTEKITIDSFKAPVFSEFGPVTFSINYANSGNIHLKPSGIISITDMFGNKSADVKVEGTNVFPEAKRIVNAKWDKQFLIGRYNATALIYTGSEKNETMTATTHFIVFPIRYAVIGIVVLVALYLLRRRLSKAYKALAGK